MFNEITFYLLTFIPKLCSIYRILHELLVYIIFYVTSWGNVCKWVFGKQASGKLYNFSSTIFINKQA